MASKKIITAFLLLQIGFSQEINLNNDSNDPVLSPILKSIPLHLLAYYIAVIKNCNVDQPRNLAKSVTVE